MERFVFFAAIVFAVIFGLGAVFSSGVLFGGDFHFEFDEDGRGTAAIVDTDAARLEPTTLEGAELRLKHLAAVVMITPEDRSDFVIEIDNPGGTPMPTVSAEAGRVTVDGQLRGRIRGCRDDGGANLRGYENVSLEQLPRVTIRAPLTVTVDRGGAGSTEIAAADSVDMDFSGCGTAAIADVAGELELEVAGSGRITAGAARRLNTDVAGSGEVSVGAIAEHADVDLAGSGTVTIASLNGSLSADAAGSGNIVVQGGAITTADIDLAGSGDVDIAAPIQALSVSIVGSGDVDVTAAVGDVDADIAGSGGVNVQSVTGAVRKQVWGSGDVRVGP